jgi:hypothetical protein
VNSRFGWFDGRVSVAELRAPRSVNRLGAPASVLMMGWLTLVLWLDRAGGGGSHWLQRGLGVATWLVLLAALTRVTPVVRVQTLVVVVFATGVEFLASPFLHVYTYRFHNVPMFVPPGHGLVYLSAFALGHSRFVERRLRTWTTLALLVGGVWAVHGLFLAQRQDALGAFWFVCLVLFVLFGPSKAVYFGAFVAVSYLELVGTGLGNWAWGTHDPTGWVTIGNPPSGAAGGYGWFDLVGLLAAPYLLRLSRRASGKPVSPGPAKDPLTPPPAERVDVS